MKYLVKWEVWVEANSPREALLFAHTLYPQERARQAVQYLLGAKGKDLKNTAEVFHVFAPHEIHRIDLAASQGEPYLCITEPAKLLTYLSPNGRKWHRKCINEADPPIAMPYSYEKGELIGVCALGDGCQHYLGEA